MASFYNVNEKALPDAETIFFTSASDATVVLSILCANTSASAADITVNQLDASNATLSALASTITIPNDASLELLGNNYILPSGRKLAGLTNVSGSIDVSISYVEI